MSARDALSGRLLWHHAGPLEHVEVEGSFSPSFDLGVYANSTRKRAISPFLHARPTLAEGRLVASVQAAQPHHRLDEFVGNIVTNLIAGGLTGAVQGRMRSSRGTSSRQIAGSGVTWDALW